MKTRGRPATLAALMAALALVLALPAAASAQRPKPGATKPRAPIPTAAVQPAPAAVDSSEKPDEPDGLPPDPIIQRVSKPQLAFATGRVTQPLGAQANAATVVEEATKRLNGQQVHVTLLGGEKYMINSCLGIKASAGEFKVTFANPTAKLEGHEVTTTFKIDRVTFNALKIRMRPNADIFEPCKFSKRFKVGGFADDVKLRVTYTPFIDPTQCIVTGMGSIDYRWTIDDVNLQPLQNNLDHLGKNMIEDALNSWALGQMGTLIRNAINGALGMQGGC